MNSSPGLVDHVAAARTDRTKAVLEGVHAVKHAQRFGAVFDLICSPDPERAADLLQTLAPDVVLPPVTHVAADVWRTLAPHGLPSPLLAIARRPLVVDVLAERDDRPVILLEGPTHLGNVGASIRVAAAADAAGLVVLGEADPWHPTAIRGAAGLQFALPVARLDTLPHGPRPLVAVHPDGDREDPPPPGTILAFGTERHGLSPELLARADHRLALPMRAGVSSLNLATTVSAVLYRHHA